jgi:hypothetical protein
MNTNTNAIDDDLARSVSQSLSLGSSTLVNFTKITSVVVLPRNLHPGLYNNSMNDVHLNNVIGVAGFPDFPDCWQGEPSSVRQCQNRERKCNTSVMMTSNNRRNQRRQHHQRRLMVRQAVNTFGIIKSTNVIKKGNNEIKKRLHEKRRLQRIEYIAKLRERVKQKQDMGAIIRGMELIKCN